MPVAQAQAFRAPKSVIKPSVAQSTHQRSSSASSGSRSAVSATDSLRAMKSFLHMSLGSLLYLRALLPVDSFEDTAIGSFRVQLSPAEGETITQVSKEDKTIAKVLRQGHTDQADYLRDVIDSNIMAAISSGYLKSLMLLVILDEAHPENVTETYTFNFFYGRDCQVELGLNLSGTKKVETFARLGAACTADQLRFQMRHLLRTIVMSCRNLNDLPQRRFLDFKLFLAENTPADYRLPQMRPVKDKLLMTTRSLSSAPLFLGRGQAAQTGHHGVSFRLTTVIQSMYRREASPAPDLDTALDQDEYRRKRAREELEDREEDRKRRRVIWDPETGVSDRTDLDPSCLDPLTDVDARLVATAGFDKARPTLCQPLGWLLPNGNLQEILIGRFPWAENEGDTQPIVGVSGRNLSREAALNHTRNSRYMPGWTQMSQSVRTDPPGTDFQSRTKDSQDLPSGSTHLEPRILNISTRQNYAAVTSVGRRKNVLLFLPASMEEDDVDLPVPKKWSSPSKSRKGKVSLKPSLPTHEQTEDTTMAPAATPTLVSVSEESTTTTTTPHPQASPAMTDATGKIKPAKRSVSKRAAHTKANGTTLPPSRKPAGKRKAPGPAPVSARAPAPVFTPKPIATWVDCYCQAQDESDNMAFCMECARPMHMPCAGYLKKDLMPESFVCLACTHIGLASQMDPDKRESDLRELALYRRALSFIRSVGSLQSYDQLNHELVTETTGCKEIVKRLTDEGFVSNPGKAIRQFPRKWNNTPSQNAKLQIYFEPGGLVERRLFGLSESSSQGTIMLNGRSNGCAHPPSDDGRPGMDIDSMEGQNQGQQDVEDVEPAIEFEPAALSVPMRRCRKLIDLTLR